MGETSRAARRWVLAVSFSRFIIVSAVLAESPGSPVGREVAVPRHLQDGEEFNVPLSQLIQYGSQLFSAKFTVQEGAGRPLSKGTGAPLSDSSSPLLFPRNFDRLSGPDANACSGCHNSPVVGAGGDRVTEVFVLAQRFDRLTFDHIDTIATRGSMDESGKFVTLENAANAFFWENGMMTDLGTLGGDNSEAIWLNEKGFVVGSADLAGPSGGQTHDAVVWINGKIHDLGTVPGDACSRGRGLNVRGQAVGGSSDCHNFLHAFLWEDGGPMVDLNTLIPPGSGVQLTNAFNINDRGEILAKAAPIGFTPNDDADLGHLALLIPCDGQHPNLEGCDHNEP
jgi:probable HAF family extracellular repeat protein